MYTIQSSGSLIRIALTWLPHYLPLGSKFEDGILHIGAPNKIEDKNETDNPEPTIDNATDFVSGDTIVTQNQSYFRYRTFFTVSITLSFLALITLVRIIFGYTHNTLAMLLISGIAIIVVFELLWHIAIFFNHNLNVFNFYT